MAVTGMDKLLVLQERDMHRRELEEQLKAVPREVATVEQRIATERAAIEAAKTEWRELESKKKLLETEISSAEEQVGRYRTQQLQVRKNDEYQALTHEIETTQAAIGTLEEQELAVLYGIDDAKKRFTAAEATLKENIAGHESRIRALRERAAGLEAECKAAGEAVAAARAEVPGDMLRLYDRLATKPGLPVCVPVTAGRCGGCHLKVSANIEMEARRAVEVATCDQCSRMVYWQP